MLGKNFILELPAASAWFDNMAATIPADHHRSFPAILHGLTQNWVIGQMSAI